MKHATERGVIMLGLILAAGCRETRYVSCIPRRPDVEARSYKWNDPFPDDTIGPRTYIRPRDFDVPRSDTRKTFDYLHKIQDAPATGPQSQAYWNRGSATTTVAVQPAWQGPNPGTPVATDTNVWDDSIPSYNVVR